MILELNLYVTYITNVRKITGMMKRLQQKMPHSRMLILVLVLKLYNCIFLFKL